MSEELLTILKLCLLALLYLFFFRVLRAVWAELRVPTVVPAAAPTGARASAAAAAAPAPAKPKRGRNAAPAQLRVLEPPETRGTVHAITDELTIGRAGGCQIAIAGDTYVSSLHARVFRGDGQVFVEDLGSTNGTFLNRGKVGAATPMKAGDHLQVGNTVFEVG